MSTQPHPDDCPKCGTRVPATASHGVGSRGEGEALPEANEQAATCPNCNARLHRTIGSAWREDTVGTVEPMAEMTDEHTELIDRAMRQNWRQ
jgi:hypothetical protein